MTDANSYESPRPLTPQLDVASSLLPHSSSACEGSAYYGFRSAQRRAGWPPRQPSLPRRRWLILLSLASLFLVFPLCLRKQEHALHATPARRRLASSGDPEGLHAYGDLRDAPSPDFTDLCLQLGGWTPIHSLPGGPRASPLMVEEFFRSLHAGFEAAAAAAPAAAANTWGVDTAAPNSSSLQASAAIEKQRPLPRLQEWGFGYFHLEGEEYASPDDMDSFFSLWNPGSSGFQSNGLLQPPQPAAALPDPGNLGPEGEEEEELSKVLSLYRGGGGRQAAGLPSQPAAQRPNNPAGFPTQTAWLSFAAPSSFSPANGGGNAPNPPVRRQPLAAAGLESPQQQTKTASPCFVVHRTKVASAVAALASGKEPVAEDPDSGAEDETGRTPSPNEEDELKHPFVRLPRLKEGVKPRAFVQERMLHPLAAARQHVYTLREIRELLLQPLLTQMDADKLVSYSEDLAAHAFRTMTKSVEWDPPAFAAEQLGRRFMVFSALDAVSQALRVDWQQELWWHQLGERVPTGFDMQRVKAGGLAYNIELASDLRDALALYKKGRRPADEFIVSLKRRLLCKDSSPRDLKNPIWNPWRDDNDWVRRGLVGRNSRQTIECELQLRL
ncbi:hypothetical protein Efla_001979 [Eimeria flavescens]